MSHPTCLTIIPMSLLICLLYKQSGIYCTHIKYTHILCTFLHFCNTSKYNNIDYLSPTTEEIHFFSRFNLTCFGNSPLDL